MDIYSMTVYVVLAKRESDRRQHDEVYIDGVFDSKRKAWEWIEDYHIKFLDRLEKTVTICSYYMWQNGFDILYCADRGIIVERIRLSFEIVEKEVK